MKLELEETPTGASTMQEVIYDCLGIEALLNQELMMYIAKKKRLHTDSVLGEQKRQKEKGICDAESLSLISDI